MISGDPIPFEARTRLRIPLVSAKEQAGFPSPADDHMERSLDLNEHLVANPPPLKSKSINNFCFNSSPFIKFPTIS